MSTRISPAPTILRRKDVEAQVGLSRSTIYQYVKEGHFPPPVSLGRRAVGWSAAAIDQWVLERLGQSGQEPATEASPAVARRFRARGV